ncbi:MAG TPA: alkaline phosphatase family protein [Candidatus Angelobacter sp.]|jgi:phospholipase C
MSQGLDKLKHIVVLMMENRSFDHMLGAMKKTNPKINGLNGDEWNPDDTGAKILVQPKAAFQGQFGHDPDHHFAGVDLQIFGGNMTPDRVANMQGFISSYKTQDTNTAQSHAIMYYFPPQQLPILTNLATEYALFNGWFASIPGPTLCNRAFAHYGTSFGNVDMNIFYITDPILSIYDRMNKASHSSKLYYYDMQSSSLEVPNLLQNQPELFGVYSDFVKDAAAGKLPEYCFIEPNYSDHPGPGGGQILATDQHPDHNMKAGERFIAQVYNVIRTNPDLWESTLLLVVYDEHGGMYDHVIPPNCKGVDGLAGKPPYSAKPAQTGTGQPFNFDRLGVRVPAIAISPWIPKGTIVPGTEDPTNQRIFEHACIPNTVTNHFLGDYDARTDREKKSETFLDLLSDTMRPDDDCIAFKL